MQAVKSKRRNHSKTLARVAQEIGNTPLLVFNSLSNPNVRLAAKAEWSQLGGSVKARAAFNIIRTAIEAGALTDGKSLLDASSGNTAIAYGAIGKMLGIPVTICLPENASARRVELLREFGVDIVFTSPFEGTEGAQAEARAIMQRDGDNYYYADQYSNDANWQAHIETTGPEILSQTGGRITHFVAGLGTTGTFTGTSRFLKSHLGIQCIGLQPDGPMHIMEGWKHLETADVPSIYDSTLPDTVLPVSSEETVEMMEFIASEEGIRLSPSAAANLAGANQVAKSINEGVVVTVLPDSIERYRELEKEVFDK